MKQKIIIFFLAIIFIGCTSCNQNKNSSANQSEIQNPKSEIPAPQFNPDSAYAFIKAQVDFGPRVPNTKQHDACAEYLISKLKSYTPNVFVQKGTVTTFNKINLSIQNIIASFNPETKNRILLFAHWDTRPWADQDTVRKDEPILAPDDAGSGVAVLLEVARQLSLQPQPMGVDIALFDAEDYGTREIDGNDPDSYALGTQYWAHNPHVENYSANYGILLDMVGARNAQFSFEGNSKNFAGAIVDKVWKIANRIGYSDYFLYRDGATITDDHLYVNTIIKIPSIDIINTNNTGSNHGFASHWHTHRDTMDIIDTKTLKAVGQTLLEVIYNDMGL
jgi:hypothetical protein